MESNYTRIASAERIRIEEMINEGASLAEIANTLGKSPTSASREVLRNKVTARRIFVVVHEKPVRQAGVPYEEETVRGEGLQQILLQMLDDVLPCPLRQVQGLDVPLRFVYI